MLTYFNGFLSYNYNQVIKNHLLDLENSLTYIKSARAQLRARKLRLPSYVKLHSQESYDMNQPLYEHMSSSYLSH